MFIVALVWFVFVLVGMLAGLVFMFLGCYFVVLFWLVDVCLLVYYLSLGVFECYDVCFTVIYTC